MARIKYQEAAGLPVKRGRPPIGLPRKSEIVLLYLQQGKTIRETAEALKRSKGTIARALKKYGISARSRARKSALLSYSIAELKSGIRDSGLRGYARDLGVSALTHLFCY